MSFFTAEQPKDGETVLHCGHLTGKTKWHWWRFRTPTKFTRPDGTEDVAHWQVACQACVDLAGGDDTKLTVRGDGTWNGNAPFVEVPP